jgi:hypothetical protein
MYVNMATARLSKWKVTRGLILRTPCMSSKAHCHVAFQRWYIRATPRMGRHLWHATNSFHVYRANCFVFRTCVRMVLCSTLLSAQFHALVFTYRFNVLTCHLSGFDWKVTYHYSKNFVHYQKGIFGICIFAHALNHINKTRGNNI